MMTAIVTSGIIKHSKAKSIFSSVNIIVYVMTIQLYLFVTRILFYITYFNKYIFRLVLYWHKQRGFSARPTSTTMCSFALFETARRRFVAFSSISSADRFFFGRGGAFGKPPLKVKEKGWMGI